MTERPFAWLAWFAVHLIWWPCRLFALIAFNIPEANLWFNDPRQANVSNPSFTLSFPCIGSHRKSYARILALRHQLDKSSIRKLNMRKDSKLSKLTEEQQADLFDWLSTDTYEAVQERLAKEPPDGFGLRLHINTLFRFYKDRLAHQRALDLASLPADPETQRSLSTNLSSVASAKEESSATVEARSPRNSFIDASRDAHAHATWMLAHSPGNLAAFRATGRALHAHDELAIKRDFVAIARDQLTLSRERLAFDREQFEFAAARAALAVLPDLIAIHNEKTLTEEARIHRVRLRLFGPDANLTCAPAASGVSAKTKDTL